MLLIQNMSHNEDKNIKEQKKRVEYGTNSLEKAENLSPIKATAAFTTKKPISQIPKHSGFILTHHRGAHQVESSLSATFL